MSNSAMSNDTDLDWLARNVHEWPAGEHQPWCYVYMTYGGVMKAAGNFLDAVANPAMITIDQWISRRAELQNKPTEWPKRANWLAQHEDGEWTFYSDSADNPPQHRPDGNWYSDDVAVKCCHSGEVLGDWRDTLEKRPEQTIADLCREVTGENRHEEIFEPFVGAEDSKEQDMKQDNGWFERGELPPVGVVCEAYIDLPQKWIEAEIVAHKDGFAIGWCKSVMKGCHGDKAREFRPIRTERDVLIEIIKKTDDTDDRIADAILEAGFKRGAA